VAQPCARTPDEPNRQLRPVSEPTARRHLRTTTPTAFDATVAATATAGPAEPETPSGTEPAADSDVLLVPVRRVRLTPAALVTLRPTYWLWEGRIPHGALTLGPGREGIGKSLFCAWLAAHVTRGELPGVYHGQARSVVYAATEDSWERTIAGRLIAAGADLDRVYRVEVDHPTAGTAVPLSLPRDCDALAGQLTAHQVALLILDPLISAVDSRININQEELRTALEPLAALADRTGCAVFGLAHFNKAGGTDVLSRITGSRAFAAVARAAIAFARDPAAPDGSCVISQAKNNLGRLDIPSLRYIVESVTLHTPDGPGHWGRLRITGETDTHVETILNDTDHAEDHTERDAAAAWLEDYLTEHSKTPSAAVKKAGKTAGFAERTLTRAARTLNVTITSEGFPRMTYWKLA
jgi:AAA domain